MGTLFTGIIVLGLVGMAVRSLYRKRKSGSCSGCGGSCGGCGGCGNVEK